MSARITRKLEVLGKALPCAVLMAAIGSGCIMKGINAGHYSYHLETGLKALDAGNFAGAKRQFGSACWYAQAGSLGPDAEAAATYNYALAIGQLGQLAKAEELLKRAMELDKKAEGETGPHASMRLFELARLYQAQRKYELASEYYAKAFAWVDRYGADKVKDDPIGLAAVLDDYAQVLEKTGEHIKSEVARVRAQRLREDNPSAKQKTKIRHYPDSPQKAL